MEVATKTKSTLKNLALMSLLIVFIVSSFASPVSASNFSKFTELKSYSSQTFTDIPSDSWFESGVSTVYKKGIMTGMGNEKFNPQANLTWAESMAIAVRIHGICQGQPLPEKTEPWYESCILYAVSKDLLPTTCPKGTAVAEKKITRQEISYLFSKLLPESDLPSINNRNIPDQATIAEEFRNSVTFMYSAGIITGKKDNIFDPEGLATRAEIAAITTRLLSPAQRVGYDIKRNNSMDNQETNVKAGAAATFIGDTAYYAYEKQKENKTSEYFIISRAKDGYVKTCYSSTSRIENLSCGEEGKIYFTEKQWLTDGNGNKSFLNSLDISTGKVEEIYKNDNSIMTYTFYDGAFYILKQSFGSISTSVDDWRYSIIKVSDKATSIISDNITFAYFITFNNAGNYDNSLYRINLLLPGEIEKMTVLPNESSVAYRSLHFYAGKVYLQASGASKVWEISPSGKVSLSYNLESPYIESSLFTPQVFIEHAPQIPVPRYNARVHYSDCSTGLYGDFLQRSVLFPKDAYRLKEVLDEKSSYTMNEKKPMKVKV